MAEHTLYDVNGYLFWVTAIQLPNGKWEGYAFFERKAHHANAEVPGVRYRLLSEFDTWDEAVAAVQAHAEELARNDEVNF
ncbi:hypothetical protein PTE30175_04548 [Pandoraea terrae]|uniref:Uncharacterized protein n=1 Tax=Pandoraea terrae TaxID=1537710 RepID=A0A5E4YQY1_9BURK|nr:hypothetical protein [Pandoraea terrae]VVE50323.1 hypothetical protein PTE30175_04548 [Pandoraea terrae]